MTDATRRTIAPAKGVIVRKPYEPFDLLKPEGEEVVWSSHWERRWTDGDVVDVPAEKKETGK